MNLWKRIASVTLAVLLCLSLLPMGALASQEEAAAEIAAEEIEEAPDVETAEDTGQPQTEGEEPSEAVEKVASETVTEAAEPEVESDASAQEAPAQEVSEEEAEEEEAPTQDGEGYTIDYEEGYATFTTFEQLEEMVALDDLPEIVDVAYVGTDDITFLRDIVIPENLLVDFLGKNTVIVPAGVTVTVRGALACSLSIEGTLINQGALSINANENEKEILISGTLVNETNAWIGVDDGVALRLTSGGSYSGRGEICVHTEDVSSVLIGFDLSQFRQEVDRWDDYVWVTLYSIDGLTQLATPTELTWGMECSRDEDNNITLVESPSSVAWKNNSPSLNKAVVRLYKAGSDKLVISSMHLGYSGGDRPYMSSSILDSLELESGDYYFTVTSIGDDKEYYDSETAVSEVWTYVRPDARYGTCTDVELLGEYSAFDGTYNFRFKLPDTYEAEFEAYGEGEYVYEIYFAENEDGEPQKVYGSTTSCDGGNGVRYGYFDSWPVKRYGVGWYSVRVRLITTDFTQVLSGEWSELSEAVYIDEIPDSTGYHTLTFTTFDELEEILQRDDLPQWVDVQYVGTDDITILRDVTIPLFLCVYFGEDTTVVIPSGVTVTAQGDIGNGKFCVDGSLCVVDGVVYVNALDNEDHVTLGSDLACVQYTYNVATEEELYQAIDKANTSQFNTWIVVRDSITIHNDLVIGEKCGVYFGNYSDDSEMILASTVAEGVTLTNHGNILIEGDYALCIEGTLLNDGECHNYGKNIDVSGILINNGTMTLSGYDERGKLRLLSGGKYSGQGLILTTEAEDCLVGFDLSQFQQTEVTTEYGESTIELRLITIIALGDLNGDGTVNLKDVTVLFQYVNKQIDDLDNMDAADVDGNGKVELKDVTKLFQYVNKQIDSL